MSVGKGGRRHDCRPPFTFPRCLRPCLRLVPPLRLCDDQLCSSQAKVDGFGPSPPLLAACKWVPTAAMKPQGDLSHDVAFDAALRYDGAFAFHVNTRVRTWT